MLSNISFLQKQRLHLQLGSCRLLIDSLNFPKEVISFNIFKKIASNLWTQASQTITSKLYGISCVSYKVIFSSVYIASFVK